VTGPVLSLRHVGIRRGDRDVLRDVSFDVRQGELVALMGPSGSGKTSVLRAVAGLDPFASGEIALHGLTLAPGLQTAAVRRALHQRVGMVFQFHCLFEHLTALENVCLAPIHVQRVPAAEAERRGRALLSAFDVEPRAAALPRELSGGEAQRVAIARALAVDPPLLLMDEPTASLDPARRAELGDLLHGLLRQGRTLLMATHDEDFARAWATRVLQVGDARVGTAYCSSGGTESSAAVWSADATSGRMPSRR
jgi:ABC-type polar amino acid transport system ATPase subunit